MSSLTQIKNGPKAYTGDETSILKRALGEVGAGTNRILIARYKIPEGSQAILDVVFSSMLLSNYLLIGSGSGKIVKLIDLVGVGRRFKDIECYAAINYGRALLGGGFASFNNLKQWCHTLGLDAGDHIMGMNRFSDVENFLQTCSTQTLVSQDLEVAEASIAMGGIFDGEERFRPFDLLQRSSIVSEVTCEDYTLPVPFDQVSDFGNVIVRTSKSKNSVQLDMDLTNMQEFLGAFAKATGHLCDLNFMRNHTPVPYRQIPR